MASFTAPGATERFNEWRSQNAELLARVPLTAFRVEYGRTRAGLYVRVRIDEGQVPPGLVGPNEAGAADGLPPEPPAA